MGISFFITSTGTGIGKTYVTTALIRLARSKNMTVAAFKPVISGFDKSEIAGSDTGEILAALGEAPTEEAVAKISPWRFAAPLAPSMAARSEGRTLDCDALFMFSRQLLSRVSRHSLQPSSRAERSNPSCGEMEADDGLLRSARNDGVKASASMADLVLIEGVGGVMVPLDDQKTVLDWIVTAGAPAVLVAGDYLGTISHTLTAVEVLRARGVEIAAIVVSEGEGAVVPFADTLAEIARWTAPISVLALRRGADGAALAPLLRQG